MVIRIRWRPLYDVNSTWPQLALALGSVFTSLAVLAFTISIWAFISEVLQSIAFLFAVSPLSRWQVWLALAAVLLAFGQLLSRAGVQQSEYGVTE